MSKKRESYNIVAYVLLQTILKTIVLVQAKRQLRNQNSADFAHLVTAQITITWQCDSVI